VRNLEQMVGRLIGEDVRLELQLAAQPGRVLADPGQLEQVVTNLAVNARDAMPMGGRLTIETANVEFDETYTQSHRGFVPGRYVQLAVTDTGFGMDKATVARLFEPFFTTKPRGKGTGLGLATVYGIVKQSGGHVWVYSEPGQGTTFKIYLPRSDAAPGPRGIGHRREVPRGKGELILLVEDEAPLRVLCATVLTHLGYRVVAAVDGPDALQQVQELGLEPALVLTDVIMPGMSGAELSQRLRQARPDLKVLFMSGYPDDAVARHGVLDPGVPFIQKPFLELTLAVKVRETLGQDAEIAGVAPAMSDRKAAAAPCVRRVLMIDDDEQYRELVGHLCARRGHVFAGVDSAGAALAALAGQTFDVLLVDLNIPGTSGERVLREIRAAGHAAPAIILTGDVASADMDVLRPLGAALALEKSSDGGPLLQGIELALQQPPSVDGLASE
jgi:CheY-like chemotaxis protein